METLYRKYRPQKFNQVVGQDHIVSVLEASIKKGNISHAYLFSGSRGTGKTSIARILARELGIHENDIYEIDAASQNSVDDIRALTDGVNTLPFQSKHKIYILDEVHMLSKAAWNAFLKTLEEPPAHAIFVLATTEIEKVPETVVSRCQTFTFKKPSETILKEVVLEAAKKEGTKITKDAAELIAVLGDGSFRDSYGILQKVLTVADKKEISSDEVEKVTGAPKNSVVNSIITAISKGDIQSALESLSKAIQSGVEAKTLLKLIIYKARAVLLLRFDKTANKALGERFSEEDLDILKSIADDRQSKLNAASLLELFTAYETVGRFVVPELPIELSLIRILDINN